MAGLVKDLQEENQQLMAETQRLNGSLEKVRATPPSQRRSCATVFRGRQLRALHGLAVTGMQGFGSPGR